MNSRRAYVRERDLSNGAHICIARFLEKGSYGDFGINIIYLSPVKAGKKDGTEIRAIRRSCGYDVRDDAVGVLRYWSFRMSDCFDHYVDAYDQDEAMGGCGSGFGLGKDYGPSSHQSNPRCRNCFSTNVFWRKGTAGNWVLCDCSTKKQHLCGLIDIELPIVPYKKKQKLL